MLHNTAEPDEAFLWCGERECLNETVIHHYYFIWRESDFLREM